MIKAKKSRSDFVTVNLKEHEWVKVLEASVPQDLIWLGEINMLHPVQFDRAELGLLIYCVREHAATFKRPRERAALERIADKLAEAMRTPPTHPASPKRLPNNKETALKVMRQDLQGWQNTPIADDPVFKQYKKAIEGLTGKPLSHHYRPLPKTGSQE